MLKFGVGKCFLGAHSFLVRKLAQFLPSTQFVPAFNGLWLDPTDYTTLSQDNAGTTPVTAVTQPVGRMLDKSGRNNTILQATATARPIQSARFNFLTKTEQFDDASWNKQSATITANTTIDPLGGTTADTITASASGPYVGQVFRAVTGSASRTLKIYAKAITSGFLAIVDAPGTGIAAYFNLNTGAVTNVVANYTANAVSIGGGWYLCTLVSTLVDWSQLQLGLVDAAGSSTGTAGTSLALWGADLRPTQTLNIPAYQRVDTAALYDTVGFPQFQTFDGVNSGMATGAITLSANMDCFIAVRKATVASVMLAFPAVGAASNYFGLAISADAAAADIGAGVVTYAANGVSLNGGLTGVTRAQLFTALTVGSWVVIEIRNLDLSAVAWNAFGIGNYTSYFLNGDFGGIILAPAGDATARQNNRRNLGAKVGLTLP